MLALTKIHNIQSSGCLAYGDFNINYLPCFGEVARFMQGGLEVTDKFPGQDFERFKHSLRVKTLWLL